MQKGEFLKFPYFRKAMKATYIDYSETHSFSSTVLSYVSRDPKLRPFLFNFPSIPAFAERIENKKDTCDRALLQKILKAQYKSLKNTRIPDKVLSNIELLSLPETYTITTGHQLNIFTGPLYFIYKIVTAINLARDLKAAYPDKNFVPVYWMASEDHDFAEINHVSIHGKSIAWHQEQKGATGKIPTTSIQSALREYQKVLGLSENSKKLALIMEEAYLEHDHLSEATRYLVNALFAEFGLVILDADHPELKKLFSPIIAEDIIYKNSFRIISETGKQLTQEGFSTQATPREINFFYMTEGLRERIVEHEGDYLVLNTDIRFTPSQLREEIILHPERFSPNVIMRPLYQEWILPNLAYVGGGAEMVYWMQLKANFDYYDVSYPLLVLRNSALLTRENFNSKLGRLQLNVRDLFSDTSALQKEWVLRHTHHELSLSDEKNEFRALFEKLKLRAYKVDPTLAPSTEAVKTRFEKALDNLEKKFIKAEKRNHEDALSQIEALRNKYFPGGALQERTENLGLFYVKHGEQLIVELIKHFKPLDFKFTIIEP